VQLVSRLRRKLVVRMDEMGDVWLGVCASGAIFVWMRVWLIRLMCGACSCTVRMEVRVVVHSRQGMMCCCTTMNYHTSPMRPSR
jgi:hypothetical protein